MATRKTTTYETLHPFLVSIFAWMMPFMLGSVFLIFAIKLNKWNLWPFILIFFLVSLVAIIHKISLMYSQYMAYCKKYGAKKYSAFAKKDIWQSELYGIIALLVLLFSLIMVVFS